jgi:hypothetical protein
VSHQKTEKTASDKMQRTARHTHTHTPCIGETPFSVEIDVVFDGICHVKKRHTTDSRDARRVVSEKWRSLLGNERMGARCLPAANVLESATCIAHAIRIKACLIQ